MCFNPGFKDRPLIVQSLEQCIILAFSEVITSTGNVSMPYMKLASVVSAAEPKMGRPSMRSRSVAAPFM